MNNGQGEPQEKPHQSSITTLSVATPWPSTTLLGAIPPMKTVYGNKQGLPLKATEQGTGVSVRGQLERAGAYLSESTEAAELLQGKAVVFSDLTPAEAGCKETLRSHGCQHSCDLLQLSGTRLATIQAEYQCKCLC